MRSDAESNITVHTDTHLQAYFVLLLTWKYTFALNLLLEIKEGHSEKLYVCQRTLKYAELHPRLHTGCSLHHAVHLCICCDLMRPVYAACKPSLCGMRCSCSHANTHGGHTSTCVYAQNHVATEGRMLMTTGFPVSAGTSPQVTPCNKMLTTTPESG